MSSKPIDIPTSQADADAAPTPQNTPAVNAPISQSILAARENAPGATPNAALMGLLQGRLNSLIGMSSGYIESLPKPVRERINALRAVQAKHTDLETEFHKELYELEKKYNKLYEPLYKRRQEIVTGSVQPTEDEIKKGAEIEAEEKDPEESKVEEIKDEEKPEGEESKDSEAPKGIPEFWSTALQNHPRLAELITERDAEALKHLTDITLEYLEGEELGFNINFEFEENPFFENKTLTKTFHYSLTEEPGSMTSIKATGTEIKWKEDKDLTVITETKKQRHKATNRTRVVKRTVPAETFFTFFDTLSEDDEEAEEDFEIQERIEAEYELGEEFKEQIIPRAVDWFTGKAISQAFSDNEFEDDPFDGEYDDDESDDDEFDEDDDEEGLSHSAKNSEKPPQCNQQ
ncbi:histone chaperone [Mycoemilia scoparia]|uniref:Histone chaperone n=1 Tax=Mycoemilia scoparia TaxID=417184 RepID=A0A9W8A8P4_9FUNG|nr:histone chaperone [Mycoemilia scoparia]